MITDDSEVGKFLAHHGILGMHWGQHKAQPASTRSSASVKTTAPKVVKVSTTHDTKMEKGDAIVLGTIGVGTVGYLGYAAGPEALGVVTAPLYAPTIKKDIKNIETHTATIDKGKDFLRSEVNTDIPMGTVFHRVASYKEKEVNAPKYATYLKDDVLRYRNTWITPGRGAHSKHYVTRMEATKSVTIASPDSIRATIEKEMHTKLSDGQTLHEKYIQHHSGWLSKGEKIEPELFSRDIISHNRQYVWGDGIGKATSEIMQKAGYAAVTDVNNTGSMSRKHAVIILDKEAFKVTSTRLASGERVAAGIVRSKIAKELLRAAAKKI